MKKDSFWSRMGNFLMGKGFYMVLLLCVTAIGASGYYLYDLASSDLEAQEQAAASAPAEVEVEVESDEEVPQETMTEEEIQQELTDVLAQAEAEAEMNVEEEEETEILPEAETVSDTPEAVPEEAETEPEPVQETVQPQETPVEAEEEATVFTAPVDGEAVAAFSNQELTYNAALEDWRTHNGVDLAAELGDPVLAAMDGEVLEVKEDLLLGTTVTINHGDGLMTIYGNLSHDVAVEQGEAVKAGDTIGTVGSTAVGEWNEGNWIHFAVQQDGEAVDPSDYLVKAEAP